MATAWPCAGVSFAREKSKGNGHYFYRSAELAALICKEFSALLAKHALCGAPNHSPSQEINFGENDRPTNPTRESNHATIGMVRRLKFALVGLNAR
jgi:hypothetical protein